MIDDSMVDPSFASTTGFTAAQISDSVHAMHQTFIGFALYFLETNAAHIVAWVMILLVLLFLVGIMRIIRFI
jgi:hypothetical protein